MPLMPDSTLFQLRDTLLNILREYQQPVVAFSAGVDSTVVARAAVEACGSQALAVTASSPSLASGELDEAIRLAEQMNIRHEVIHTDEFSKVGYQKNAPNRCYFCKTELYSRLQQFLLESNPHAVIVNGANLDDCGDHRPGMQAASEHAVRSPLIEAGFNKQAVRELAEHWQLPVADKPAMPCLSSRIAYGVEVTPERVQRIDAAESFLRTLLGERELRVRCEQGELARIEVHVAAIPLLCNAEFRTRVQEKFVKLGFRRVTVDLAGFKSGSLNAVVPVEQLQIFSNKPADSHSR